MEIMEFIGCAKEHTVSMRLTCLFLGITPRTIQNWRKSGMIDRRKGSARHVEHRLSLQEEQEFYDTANSPKFKDSTPEQIVAILASEGKYIASTSSLYRILRKRNALQHRQESKKPRKTTIAETYFVTAPDQVYVWDITWLKTDIQGFYKYAYTVIDLFDRFIVGWSIEDAESDELASKLFARIVRDKKVKPLIVHSDNGHSMRGVSLAVFLDNLHISRSYSRPRCSNDNAFIESYHKTLKYTVGYPKFFTSIEHARTWYANFANWYNTEHLHSSVGYVTPYQKRIGEAEAIYSKRDQTIREAREKNPLRWRRNITRTYKSLPVSFEYRPIKKPV
jgi:transposase InsO family protein